MKTASNAIKAIVASIAIITLQAASGCASSGTSGGSIYVHPNADFSIYGRVAVLPLDNLTTDRFAGERVREILVVELSAQGQFELVETGEVNRVLRVQNITNVYELGPEGIAALGQTLGVQAIFLGSVMDFRERRIGTITAPEVAVSLRLIDVASGTAIWSATDARAGVGTWTRLFGVGEQSQSEAAREVVLAIIDTIY